jgi:PPP family 3-phenylpropionic acid transporter
VIALPVAEPLLASGAVPTRWVASRLALFYAAYFVMLGIVLPFWPAWLQSRGLSAAQIGLLLALGSWAKLVGNPIFTRIADRSGEIRRPLILIAAAALTFQTLFLLAHGFWALLIVTVLSALCFTTIMPLGDSLALGLAAHHGLHYGRVRLWGSVAFIVAGTAAGWLLAGRSAGLVLPLVIAALALTLLACLVLPEAPRPAVQRAAGGWLTLLSNRRFALFVLAAGLIQSSHAILYGFGTLHWLAAGHDEDTVGILWAIGVAAEVALFAVGGGVVARLGPLRLLMLAGLGGIIRWTVAALSTDLTVLAVIQLLHGLTFGAAHLSAMYYIMREVPAGLAATAQGLYGALAWGAAFGLTMLAAGALYAAHAGGAFFVMAGMCLAGTVVALILTGGKH